MVAAVQLLEIYNFYYHLNLETLLPSLNLAKTCYTENIGFPIRHIYSACKTVLPIRQNMKTRTLQKVPISQLLRWKNLEVQSNIRKAQFSISSMSWEKWGSPDRTTFENPNFKSLWKLPKT